MRTPFKKTLGIINPKNQPKSQASNLPKAFNRNEGSDAIPSFLSVDQAKAFNAIPNGVSLHDQNGKLLWASDITKHIINANATPLEDFGFLKGVNPQDSIVLLNEITNLFETDDKAPKSVHIRKQIRSTDGDVETRTFECKCILYKQAAHGKTLVLLNTSDISSHEQSLGEVKGQIEEAENARHHKSSFITNVSHELRTPLTAIIGFSEILEGKSGEEMAIAKRREYSGLITQSASDLLKMLNNVLDLSKMEAQKLTLDKSYFDLCEVATNTMKMLQPIADKKKVVLRSKLAEELPQIDADPQAVKQIITNLVANAIKFSKDQSCVTLTIQRTARKMQITVSDMGIGMDRECVEKLGTEFFQAKNLEGKSYEGTGLGLSIVYGLVHMHDGSINFDSEIGKGTNVRVNLPINPSQEASVPANPDDQLVFLNRQDRSFNGLTQMKSNKIERTG